MLRLLLTASLERMAMALQRVSLFGKQLAGVVLAAGLVMPATRSDTPAPPGMTLEHARVNVHRNDDGSLKRGLRNQVETSNWSGYAVANFSTGELYSAAQASWMVPTVSYKPPPPVCHSVYIRGATQQVCSSASAEAEYSSSWVGIGGFCENANCTTVDNTLIQIGTEQDVSASGATQYYAWVEMLPNNPIVISSRYPACDSLSCAYPVAPGDNIIASLSCRTNCSNPGQTQSWGLTMRNATQGWTFSTTVSYASTLLSAAWIEEAPSSSAGILPLADFTTVTVDPTVNAADSTPNLTGSDAIVMVDPYGETSSPSSPESSSNNTFAICWGNNPTTIASCSAP
jgi:Peptidase A4 family